jgi:hypothetical protein
MLHVTLPAVRFLGEREKERKKDKDFVTLVIPLNRRVVNWKCLDIDLQFITEASSFNMGVQ